MTMVQAKRRKTVTIIAAVSGTLVILLFLLFGPPQLLARSDQPLFCVQCHVMESEYEAWAHAGAHRRKMCVDCHLPNGNAGVHYVWKSIDGMKDVVFFYAGAVPERIHLTAHGAKVLQENCIRCHEQTVALIDNQRHCWECHRRIMHTRSGVIQTL
jgi:cytochrome c nitrite reductase small subunit